MSQNIVQTTNVVEKTPQMAGSFFVFLSCIWYTRLVDIINIFGTPIKSHLYSTLIQTDN